MGIPFTDLFCCLIFGANDGAIWGWPHGDSLLHKPVEQQTSSL